MFACLCLPGPSPAAQHRSCTTTSQNGCTKLSRLHLPGLLQRDRHSAACLTHHMLNRDVWCRGCCRFCMDRGSLLMAVELPDGRPHMVSLQEAYALLVRTWPCPAALLLRLYSSLLPAH